MRSVINLDTKQNLRIMESRCDTLLSVALTDFGDGIVHVIKKGNDIINHLDDYILISEI